MHNEQPKFYLDKLPSCQYGVPSYRSGDAQNCGEPVSYLASWFYGGAEPEEMYLCEEHAELVEAAECGEEDLSETDSSLDKRRSSEA